MRTKRNTKRMFADELEKMMANLEKAMKKAAAQLDFETAAELRDRMIEVKKCIRTK